MFHGTLGGKILLIIHLSITIQLFIRIYDRHIYICQIHIDIYSAVSHHTCCKDVLKPPHVVSYLHTFYRTQVWYLRKCITIVTQHNWVLTIYHHKLLVTHFDLTTVFYRLEMVTVIFGIKNIHFLVPRLLVLLHVESHQRLLMLVQQSVLGVM